MGAVFTFNVAQAMAPDAKLAISIADQSGKQVARIDVDKAQGLKRAVWDLREGIQGAPNAGGGRGGGRGGGGQFVTPGRYTATLQQIFGETTTAMGPTQTFQVLPLPEQNYKLYR